LDRLQERSKRLAEKGLTHALKKSEKKSKKRKNLMADGDGAITNQAKKTKESGIRNAATAAITSRVMEDEKLRGQLRSAEISENLKSLFTKESDGKKPGKNSDFMSRGYSLPEA
jgi:hypothetical protein